MDHDKQEKGSLRVTNCTASFKVDRHFDLIAIAGQAESEREVRIRYRRHQKKKKKNAWSRGRPLRGKIRRFHSVVKRLRIKDHIVTALMYESGAVVLVGGTDDQHFIKARNKILRNFKCRETKPLSIHNYVFAYRHHMNIKQVETYQNAIRHPYLTPTYEPELFPCLLVSLNGSNIKSRLFHTGSIIITGCKSQEDGNLMLATLMDILV